MYQVEARVATNTSGGTISLVSESTALGQLAVANTGGWQTWKTVTTTVNLTAGEQTLTLNFTGGTGFLFNVNKLKFVKQDTAASMLVTPATSIKTTLVAYPNPAQNYITLSGIINGNQLIVYDFSGNIVLQKTALSTEETLDVSSLRKGTYIISIEGTQSLQFIKQ